MNNWFIICIIIAGLLCMDMVYNRDKNKLRRIYIRSSLSCLLAFVTIVLIYQTNSMNMSFIELVLYIIFALIVLMGTIHILYIFNKEDKNDD